MSISKIIVIIFLNISFLYSNIIKIDKNTSRIDILPSSKVYLDNTKSKTLEDIKKLDDLFEPNDKKLLGYGYSPDFDVWELIYTIKVIKS
jgi:hypothetical protein